MGSVKKLTIRWVNVAFLVEIVHLPQSNKKYIAFL